MTEPETNRNGSVTTQTVLIRRHAGVIRLSHWLLVLCLAVLLASGLQIFNAHPALYWGQYGADEDPSWLAIGDVDGQEGPGGFLRLGSARFNTTGVLGISRLDGEPTPRAFPAWATLPSYQDLAQGRRWHIFFAWLFVANGLLYAGYGLLSGHFRRDLLPSREQLSMRHLGREILDHARLRFAQGDAARHYNALQKLSYLAVVGLLLPLMALSGLTMSPGIDAAVPALLDLFGGRQSARSVHFLTACLLVGFVLIHLSMVVLSGPWNNLRSMLTGRYAIRTGKPAP